MRKAAILILLIIGSLSTYGQELNAYKYVIVPNKFGFLNADDEFQVNSLTKFLFNKYGFEAFIKGEELPDDINTSTNNCNTLYADATSSGFLSTKIVLTLADCMGKVVYTSPEGKSKIKEYKEAYHEAMRDAFADIAEMDYEYTGSAMTAQGETSAPTVSATSPQAVTEAETPKTVVVSSYEKVEKPVNIVENQQKEVQNQPEETVKSPEKTEISTAAQTPAKNYTSTDGSYKLQLTEKGFDIYEGENKIGSASKTAAGSYFVNTSQFAGVGYINAEGEFVVEREIKGVSGLVKMIFSSN